MLLCDSFDSNNNKKISFQILLNVKSSVFVKLPEIPARYLHLKLKHLEEIITFYSYPNMRSYRLDVSRIREEKGESHEGRRIAPHGSLGVKHRYLLSVKL